MKKLLVAVLVSVITSSFTQSSSVTLVADGNTISWEVTDPQEGWVVIQRCSSSNGRFKEVGIVEIGYGNSASVSNGYYRLKVEGRGYPTPLYSNIIYIPK